MKQKFLDLKRIYKIIIHIINWLVIILMLEFVDYESESNLSSFFSILFFIVFIGELVLIRWEETNIEIKSEQKEEENKNKQVNIETVKENKINKYEDMIQYSYGIKKENLFFEKDYYKELIDVEKHSKNNWLIILNNILIIYYIFCGGTLFSSYQIIKNSSLENIILYIFFFFNNFYGLYGFEKIYKKYQK